MKSQGHRKPKKNDRFMHYCKEAKIMAVEDGYVMARIKGCTPFVVHVKDIEHLIFRKDDGVLNVPGAKS